MTGLVVATCLAALTGGVTAARAAEVSDQGARPLATGFAAVSLGGLAVARDGTGGLVYAATSGGVSHVYLSRLLNGAFQAPIQLDTGPLTSASQPVITADNGGQILVAFISAGQLYVADALSSDAALSAPVAIAAGAADPSISMNLYGTGYLAYTATDGSGDDVDVQYFDGTGWSPASPLAVNDQPGDVAGAGTGAPSVVAASDGVGIVAWGENGHVYSRRIWGTQTSVEVEQDDISSLNGQPELAAASPQVASGGDSSYPDIVFTETFGSAADPQTRAMLTRIIAEQTYPATPVDGIGTADENGIEPRLAMGEFGRGLITAVTGATSTAASQTPGTAAPYGVEASVLTNNGAPETPAAVPTSTSASDPAAVPAVFGPLTSAMAWSVDSGDGLGQVLFSSAPDGMTFTPPIAVSTTAGGPIQPGDGLVLGGDSRGDGALAWVQGSAPNLTIDTDQLFTAPGVPGLTPAKVATDSSQPTLAWNPANEDWGPVTYQVTLDGAPLAQTAATSLQVPDGLTDGTYSWQVSGTNLAGLTTSTPTGSIVVDTVAPRLRLRLVGTPRVKALQHLALAYDDPPNPAEPGATASGIKSVTVTWGDGAKPVTTVVSTGLSHVYAKVGVYRITAVATDRTGNTVTLSRIVRVLP